MHFQQQKDRTKDKNKKRTLLSVCADSRLCLHCTHNILRNCNCNWSMRITAAVFIISIFILISSRSRTPIQVTVVVRSEEIQSKKPVRKRPQIQINHNCTDTATTVANVEEFSTGRTYLHTFEFGRLHPCCLISNSQNQGQTQVNGRGPGQGQHALPVGVLNSSDIVFILKMTSQTQLRAALGSWILGVQDLLVVNHKEQTNFKTDKEKSKAASEAASRRASTSAKFNTINQDPQFTSHIAVLRAIWNTDAERAPLLQDFPRQDDFYSYKDKKWFFLADDETWVNVPAVVHLASQYDPDCPVAFGYVWNNPWPNQLDFISGAAGTLISQAALRALAWQLTTADKHAMPGELNLRGHDYGTSGRRGSTTASSLTLQRRNIECPVDSVYDDVMFSECSWSSLVQLVHHRGFSFDRPETSKDRREIVWLPPIAEAISYHYVQDNAMSLMTEYSNSRWQYTPVNYSNYTVVDVTLQTGTSRQISGRTVDSVWIHGFDA